MNSRTRILIAFVIGGSVGIFAGCQTYDFEPVEPLALAKTTQARKVVSRNSKPNLMLVVDKSGSMLSPINGSDSRCLVSGNPCTAGNCPSACPTRISDLKLTMRGANGNDGFLTSPSSAQVARMGLAVFPNTTANNPATVACILGKVVIDIVNTEDVPAELTAQAQAINSHIQNLLDTSTSSELKVIGGTPSSATLAVVGNQQSLNTDTREDFILFLTDGLPNCNGDTSALNPNSCTCTQAGLTPCSPVQNCLDDVATEQRIANLRSRNIRTIVVGFGAELAAGSAPAVLNKMAAAGGMARTCLKVDGTRDPALCGAEACDAATNLCATRFYSAANAAELTAALLRITQIVTNDNPCEYKLDSTPSDARLLQVKIDNQIVQPDANTWIYAPPNGTIPPKITFVSNGSVCTKLLNATPQSPVNVEISIIETL